jgi:phospholipid/cholesterol/gamma-HCH transport system ATP-binding protein
MIRVGHVYKSFDDQEILRDINAEFYAGKTNLIIGKSGSGKTVLVKCMVGLFPVSQGNIFYQDKDFTHISVKEKREIRKQLGMLFQGGALFDSMTVEQNVGFPLDMFTTMTKKEKLYRVNEVLERVNLPDSNGKFPSEISGGMRKRVGIARAIVLNPKYLFCDEPNSGLDPVTAIVIDKLIQEITREYNITTVINTHDMNSVMETGENIILIDDGEVGWRGTKEDILVDDNEKLNDFIFASNFLKEAKMAMKNRL